MILLSGTVVGLLMFLALASGLTGAYNLWAALVDSSLARWVIALLALVFAVGCVGFAMQVIQEAISG